jgi:peptide-methionine (S)-S-oxide reductase
MTANHEIATLAGGCFWCLEAVFEQIVGVESVVSGYCGGQVDHPDYAAVCTGRTGHAEAVQLTFDPARCSYRTLLEVFLAIHDPTTRDRQGNDVGSQYRSAIFYHTDEQRQVAKALVAEFENLGLWCGRLLPNYFLLLGFSPPRRITSNIFAETPSKDTVKSLSAPNWPSFASALPA